jgi:hypothetical protein
MRPFALALPVALLLVGCSGTSKTATPAPSSPLPSVDATTAAPTPSSSATPSASPSPSSTSSPTRHKPAVAGDVDGDGNPDTIRTTSTLLTVVLSSTGKSVTAPIGADSPRNAPILGSVDVDRDGFAEVFLQTAQGSSTTFATPYRFDGTTLRVLQLNGSPASLGIGGSVTHGAGFQCTNAGQVIVRGASSSDGKAYTVESRVYRVGVKDLVLVRTSTVKAKQGDPIVQQSYSVDCGSVGEGQ